MKTESRIDIILNKMNTRAFSMLAALIMILGGIYMCFEDLRVNGKIDLKTALVEGQIETGSLGLMVMFLGAIVILVLNYKSQPFKGQEVQISINGNQITGKGLSYRKLKEIVAVATDKEPEGETETHNQANSADAKSRGAPRSVK